MSMGSNRLSMDIVLQAIATQERVRRRLASTGHASASISADLAEVREGRLAEFSDDDSTLNTRQRARA